MLLQETDSGLSRKHRLYRGNVFVIEQTECNTLFSSDIGNNDDEGSRWTDLIKILWRENIVLRVTPAISNLRPISDGGGRVWVNSNTDRQMLQMGGLSASFTARVTLHFVITLIWSIWIPKHTLCIYSVDWMKIYKKKQRILSRFAFKNVVYYPWASVLITSLITIEIYCILYRSSLD